MFIHLPVDGVRRCKRALKNAKFERSPKLYCRGRQRAWPGPGADRLKRLIWCWCIPWHLLLLSVRRADLLCSVAMVTLHTCPIILDVGRGMQMCTSGENNWPLAVIMHYESAFMEPAENRLRRNACRQRHTLWLNVCDRYIQWRY